MKAINLFVRPNPLLRETVERLIAENAIRHTAIELASGEYLFREGDNIRTTFFLAKGLVKLSSVSAEGYAKTIFLHKPGTLIGFQELQEKADRKPSILNGQAITKSSVVVLDGREFSDYLKTHGDACYAMAQYLFSMLSLQTSEAVNATMYSVLERFAALLLTLAQEIGATEEPALIPFSNGELAEMLGVHVNSITNAVSALRRSGCVDRQRSYLAIIDFTKLRAIADSLMPDE